MGKTVVTERGPSPAELVRNWKEVIDTCNLSPVKRMDAVSRWLVLTRACVFQMSLTSGLIGGLLAVSVGPINWLYFGLAVLGLVIAHAANNLSNDFFDLQEGLDTKDYPRALYAPHPVLGGLTTQPQLRAAFVTLTAVSAAIGLFLAFVRGPLVLAFAATGLFISLFYTAPPLKLKYRGLGELGVFLVWGPLMIGGTYYVAAGCVGLALSGVLSVWVLIVLGSLPRLTSVWRLYVKPKPATPPENYAVWPLWYVSWAFYWTKQAGTLFVLGVILGAVFPVRLGG
jgi:hypothetical protein